MRVDGLAAFTGFTASHPELAAEAVKPPTPEITTVCGAGEPPCAVENERLAGAMVKFVGELTIKVTVFDCDPLADPDADTVTKPVCVPGASPAGATQTFKTVDVDPFAGLTKSQFPTLAAIAVKLSCDPLLNAVSILGAGAAPPV